MQPISSVKRRDGRMQRPKHFVIHLNIPSAGYQQDGSQQGSASPTYFCNCFSLGISPAQATQLAAGHAAEGDLVGVDNPRWSTQIYLLAWGWPAAPQQDGILVCKPTI